MSVRKVFANETDKQEYEERMRKYNEREERLDFLSKASKEELEAKSTEDWKQFLNEWDTGLSSLLKNHRNLSLIADDKVISILNIMKEKKQRFFEYDYYYVLHLSSAIQKWAIENMKPDYSNELYIEDKENY